MRPALISVNGRRRHGAQAAAMAQTRLARELAFVIALKLLLLTAIYALCFTPAHRADAASGVARIFSGPAKG
jgi:hypothetical protein